MFKSIKLIFNQYLAHLTNSLVFKIYLRGFSIIVKAHYDRLFNFDWTLEYLV